MANRKPGKNPKSGRRGRDRKTTEANGHQATGAMLNVLDNPDDGEIFDTGDASDFAGERRKNPTQSPDADE